jgi:hypothetical protein
VVLIVECTPQELYHGASHILAIQYPSLKIVFRRWLRLFGFTARGDPEAIVAVIRLVKAKPASF